MLQLFSIIKLCRTTAAFIYMSIFLGFAAISVLNILQRVEKMPNAFSMILRARESLFG